MSVGGATVRIGAGMAALLGALVLPAQPSSPAPFTDTAQVEIHVTLVAGGHSEVSLRLRASGDSSAQRGRFQLLTRPCTEVGSITISSAAGEAALRVTANDPWRTLDDSAGIARAASDVTLRYVVSHRSGNRDIPLVVPAHPIAHPAGTRGARVAVRVTTSDASDRVTFPRLERVEGSHEWRGEFVAVPSFVSVAQANASDTPCAPPSPARDDGGLSWRFWLLVAILVVWVPTYQWWARRQTEGDEGP